MVERIGCFVTHQAGRIASASIYSLIKTVKANNLEPFNYLYYLLNELPKVESKENLKKLPPINLKPTDFIII